MSNSSLTKEESFHFLSAMDIVFRTANHCICLFLVGVYPLHTTSFIYGSFNWITSWSIEWLKLKVLVGFIVRMVSFHFNAYSWLFFRRGLFWGFSYPLNADQFSTIVKLCSKARGIYWRYRPEKVLKESWTLKIPKQDTKLNLNQSDQQVVLIKKLKKFLSSGYCYPRFEQLTHQILILC